MTCHCWNGFSLPTLYFLLTNICSLIQLQRRRTLHQRYSWGLLLKRFFYRSTCSDLSEEKETKEFSQRNIAMFSLNIFLFLNAILAILFYFFSSLAFSLIFFLQKTPFRLSGIFLFKFCVSAPLR